jgi:hypothetical protein
MSKLADPRHTACAKARVIGIRARSISDFGNQIAAIKDPTAVSPEEWIVLSNSIGKLMEELQDEIGNFIQKASYAT